PVLLPGRPAAVRQVPAEPRGVRQQKRPRAAARGRDSLSIRLPPYCLFRLPLPRNPPVPKPALNSPLKGSPVNSFHLVFCSAVSRSIAFSLLALRISANFFAASCRSPPWK